MYRYGDVQRPVAFLFPESYVAATLPHHNPTVTLKGSNDLPSMEGWERCSQGQFNHLGLAPGERCRLQ